MVRIMSSSSFFRHFPGFPGYFPDFPGKRLFPPSELRRGLAEGPEPAVVGAAHRELAPAAARLEREDVFLAERQPCSGAGLGGHGPPPLCIHSHKIVVSGLDCAITLALARTHRRSEG